MGYNTDFSGELKFTQTFTVPQLIALEKIIGEDCRDHPEWGEKEASYIQLVLTDDKSGLEWDGGEKTYHMVEAVNVVIREMRKQWPDFGLSGELLAQGEEFGDLWKLSIGADGFAYKTEMTVTNGSVQCPECDHVFIPK